MRRIIITSVFGSIAVAVVASMVLWLRRVPHDGPKTGGEIPQIARQVDAKTESRTDEPPLLREDFQTVELDVFHDGKLENTGRYALVYETDLVEVSSGESFRIQRTLARNIELVDFCSIECDRKHSIVASMPAHVAPLVEYAKPRGHFGLFRDFGRSQNDRPSMEEFFRPTEIPLIDFIGALGISVDRFRMNLNSRSLMNPPRQFGNLLYFAPIDINDVELRPPEIVPWDITRQPKYVPCATCVGGKKFIDGPFGLNTNAPRDVTRLAKYIPCATCPGGKKLIDEPFGTNKNAQPRP